MFTNFSQLFSQYFLPSYDQKAYFIRIKTQPANALNLDKYIHFTFGRKGYIRQKAFVCLLVPEFNANFSAKAIPWRSVTHLCVSGLSHTITDNTFLTIVTASKDKG